MINSYAQHIIILWLIYSIVVMGVNFSTGLCGQVSAGQSAFFAIGAYFWALFCQKFNFEIAQQILILIPISALLGLIFGLIATRISHLSYVLTSLAFAQLLMSFFNSSEFTNGATGISIKTKPNFLNLTLNQKFDFIIFLIVINLILVLFFSLFKKSKIGLLTRAVKSDELLARFTGINVKKIKFLSIFIGIYLSCLSGLIYASYMRYVNPSYSSLSFSIMFLSMATLGGLSTSFGPLIGSLVLVVLPELNRSFAQAQYLIYGLILLLIILFRPQGLLGSGFDLSFLKKFYISNEKTNLRN